SSHLLYQDSTTDKDSSTKPTLPVLQISTDKSWSSGWAQRAAENMIKGSNGREQKEQQDDDDDDDEDSYFGVLDKYCNSDDDPTSPSTASPTSPFSGRKDFWAAQPPTPPVTSSSRRLDRHQQQQRDPFAVQSPSRRAATPLRNAPAPAQPTDLTASTTLLSPTSPTTNSPMMTASAKFSSYLQSGAVRGSRESFTLHDSPSSTNVGTNSTPRSYSKRPLPVPSSSTTATSPASNSISTSESPRVSVASTSTRSSFLSLNHSTPDLRDNRPEPPQKDTTRRMLGSAHNNTNTNTNNNNNSPYAGNKNNSSSASHLPPMLGDTHLSDSSTSFSAVVEASMERRRNASVSSGGSLTLADINPYADNATAGAASSSSTPSSNSHGNHSNSSGNTGHGYSTGSSNNKSSPRPSQLSYLTNGRSKDRPVGSNQQQLYHHQVQNNSATSLSRGQDQSQSEEQPHYRQQQRHQHQHQQQSNSPRPYDGSSLSQYSSSSPALYSPSASGGGATPSEMLSNRLNSSRMRSHSQGSISTTSSITNNNYNNNSNSYQYQHQLQQNPHQRHYGAVKPAIIKTPIARARAREAKGPRKVIFGDMITIVTIERPETPPPSIFSPGSDKDKKKKAAAAAKKKAKKGGDKTGPHPDPEYDEEYYNQPYTPVPADVLVTQAPWIGNPNYDEEKQNSKFYYEDDATEYEYDDYEYEAPFDIRSGPGDEDDEEEEEDEEDEDGIRGRAWGNGIAGGGATGAGKKKGGGMFKFKKAVNRLLRN
ncbi:hypothetical protein BG015_003417, partial [Linnemannia schmuckeri]